MSKRRAVIPLDPILLDLAQKILGPNPEKLSAVDRQSRLLEFFDLALTVSQQNLYSTKK